MSDEAEYTVTPPEPEPERRRLCVEVSHGRREDGTRGYWHPHGPATRDDVAEYLSQQPHAVLIELVPEQSLRDRIACLIAERDGLRERAEKAEAERDELRAALRRNAELWREAKAERDGLLAVAIAWRNYANKTGVLTRAALNRALDLLPTALRREVCDGE